MSNMIEQRRDALVRRIDQMREMDEWHLFQNFVLGLLPHDGYTGVRLSAVRNDFGRDAVAVTPKGGSCFVAVSFDCSLAKIRKDAKRWSEDPNREDAKVMVFITWDKVTEATLSKWRDAVKERHKLRLDVIHRETICATATREGVSRETCSRLGLPGHRTGYLRVSPYNGELVRRGLKARPPEWLKERVELAEWKELSSQVRQRVILGKPGAGKTTTLFYQLELAKPDNVLVVEAGTRESLQIEGLLDDAAGGAVIVFDDLQDNPERFTAVCSALLARKRDEPETAKRFKDVVILAASRSQEWADLQPRLPMIQLQDLGLLGDAELNLSTLAEQQCADLIRICRDEWDLKIEDRLLKQGAEEAAKRDATPLYVISMLAAARMADDLALRDEHLAGLPESILGLWQAYWRRLTSLQQGTLRVVKLFAAAEVEAHPQLLSAAADVFKIAPHDLSSALDWLEQALWITRSAGAPTSLDVQLEAIQLDEMTYSTWDTFVHGFPGNVDTRLSLHIGTGNYYTASRAARSRSHSELRSALASAAEHFQAVGEVADARKDKSLRSLALNNASVCYAHLADLETTLEARRECLGAAVSAVEESVRLDRDLGLHEDLAGALINASRDYTELAELEATPEARRRRLEAAVSAIEESERIYRDLGLHANLAASLNNASNCYSALADSQSAPEGRRKWLRKAVDAAEESIRIRRPLGVLQGLATSLATTARRYRGLPKGEANVEDATVALQRSLECIEEALALFRGVGHTQYTIQALQENVTALLVLGEPTGRLDVDKVIALCDEGVALAEPMGDKKALAWFREAKKKLTGGG